MNSSFNIIPISIIWDSDPLGSACRREDCTLLVLRTLIEAAKARYQNILKRFWRHLEKLPCINLTQDIIDEALNFTKRILIEQNFPKPSLCFHVS